MANQDFIEIFSSSPNPESPHLSIIIERILVVEFSQLPVLIDRIDNIVFDALERNVFYAIGTKNVNFETASQDDRRRQRGLGTMQENVRLEKFFIESDSFSSKTLAYLQLKTPDERPALYNISQCQDKVVVYSNKRSLYTFSLMPFKPKPLEA